MCENNNRETCNHVMRFGERGRERSSAPDITIHEESHRAERVDGNEGSQEHGSKNARLMTLKVTSTQVSQGKAKVSGVAISGLASRYSIQYDT